MLAKLFPVLCLIYLVHAIPKKWQLSTGNGQPGCRTRYEFTKLWRNNHQPSMYWECVEVGQAAVSRDCPPETLFLDYWQTCVPGSRYEWTPPYDPPSSPGDTISPCLDNTGFTESPICCCNSTDTTVIMPQTSTTTLSPPTTTLSPPTTTVIASTTTEAAEVTETPFICTADRMGLRWAGDTENTYWECYGLYEDPFLISCPPGFRFNFPLQTCVV